MYNSVDLVSHAHIVRHQRQCYSITFPFRFFYAINKNTDENDGFISAKALLVLLQMYSESIQMLPNGFDNICVLSDKVG